MCNGYDDDDDPADDMEQLPRTAAFPDKEEQIRSNVRMVEDDRANFFLLSTVERIAVALVLNRFDMLQCVGGTLAESVHRLGHEWAEAAFNVQCDGWEEKPFTIWRDGVDVTSISEPQFKSREEMQEQRRWDTTRRKSVLRHSQLPEDSINICSNGDYYDPVLDEFGNIAPTEMIVRLPADLSDDAAFEISEMLEELCKEMHERLAGKIQRGETARAIRREEARKEHRMWAAQQEFDIYGNLVKHDDEDGESLPPF